MSNFSKIKTAFLSLELLTTSKVALAGSSDLEANKKVVTSFYDLAFNQYKPTEAVAWSCESNRIDELFCTL